MKGIAKNRKINEKTISNKSSQQKSVKRSISISKRFAQKALKAKMLKCENSTDTTLKCIVKSSTTNDSYTSSIWENMNVCEKRVLGKCHNSNLRCELDYVNGPNVALRSDDSVVKCLATSKSERKTVKSGHFSDGASSSQQMRKRSVSFLDKARGKLAGAQFRYLNERLYKMSGSEALCLFNGDVDAFEAYHHGFQAQVSQWPLCPLDVIIKMLQVIPKNNVIADFGCGKGRLAESLPSHKVHSFDLIATKSFITACNFAMVPLPDNTINVAVFCLALMGTDLSDYITEAYRVLKERGEMIIAEVTSRFLSVNKFVSEVEGHGFHLIRKKDLSKMFKLVTFGKSTKSRLEHPPVIRLKPCLYKLR